MPLGPVPRGEGELAAHNKDDVVALYLDNLAQLSCCCHVAVSEPYCAGVDWHRRLAASDRSLAACHLTSRQLLATNGLIRSQAQFDAGLVECPVKRQELLVV